MEIDYVAAKTMLGQVKNRDEWFGYDYNMNIYRGCCHGCIYCDSRSECYQIEDFDRVRVKRDAIGILKKELGAKRKKGIVGTGAMSDPYNPLENRLELTRGALELLAENNFGVVIFTKSDLIIRDIDLLKQINKYNPVLAGVTITCASDELSRIVEPHVSVSSERFAALGHLAEAGIFAGVLMTPVLPFITDGSDNLRKMVQLAKGSGAKFIYSMFGMTLRANQREYYYQRLDESFPGMKERYIQNYRNNYYCQIPDGERVRREFEKECESSGLLYRMKDVVEGYSRKENYSQMNFMEWL